MRLIRSRLFPRILLLLVLSAGCKESILHDLSESEANTIITRLHDKLISGEKLRQPDGKWSIAVLRPDALRAIHDLEKGRFAPEESQERSEKASVMSSREDQRFSYERALSKEIERTLGSIEGVLYARVHLNLPFTDSVFGTRTQSGGSASILLIVDPVFEQQKEAITGIVGGASGIAHSAITVVVNKQEGSTRERVSPGVDSQGGKQPERVTMFDSLIADTRLAWGCGVFLITFGFVILIRALRRFQMAKVR